VDASVLPHAIPWHSSKIVNKDPHPTSDEFDADVCNYLADNRAPFKKFLEPFLCLVGISRYYTLDENSYPTFWADEDEGGCSLLASFGLFREVRESEVLLLELTRERVIPLVGVNDQGGVVAQGVGNDNVNEGSGGIAAADQTEHSDPIVRIGGIDIEVDAEAQALVADKPKKFRKRKTANGASGSGHPLKRLREDHGTSRDAGASTAGKSLAVLQDLLDKSTLAAEIGVTSAATIPFVTSSVTPTPEHEGGEYTDSVLAANFLTKRLAERFVISSDTPHDSNANVADDEVSSVVRSAVPDPVVLTTAVATAVVAGTSIPQPREVNEPTRTSIFSYSTTAGNVDPNVAGPSQMAGNDISSESFYVSLDMDSETLHQTYVPKWDVMNESALDEPNVCCSLVDQRAPPVFFWQLRAMEYDQLFAEFNVGAASQTCLEIAGLKAQLSLKEADVAEAIHLRSRIANIEAVDATLTGELKSLKERNAALESAVVAKDFQIAKLTQDLSSLQLSCDDLSIKASTLECEKDKLVDQVSELEATCSGLRDEVAGYKLFKEQVEAVQDEQVKALSDCVAHIDSDLMDMALHMDEEFYPRYLTTIVGRRWILSRGLKLVIMKCLQSSECLVALGGALGCAIDKGMQDGLKASVDHERAWRGLNVIAAYDPSAKANFFFAVDALRAVNFPLLAQLESQKDASMADIFDLLRSEGPAVETPEASQLQPSFEQLMVPIHRLKGDVAACRLSVTDAMVPLLEPLSVRSLTGEASTSMVPSTTVTTALLTTFVQASTILLVPSTEVPPSPKIVFEEELDTVPEHASAP
ncbi:hypothetical protein Tco_1473617, partial [Tanacetum coccineum]